MARSEGALPDTTTKAGGHAKRNAGFIRQAGEPRQGCRMNPAFRWWCQEAAILTMGRMGRMGRMADA
ncbi:MAG: hypothetical protein WCK27_26165, partial [Verrucomicrobiota bacterium]